MEGNGLMAGWFLSVSPTLSRLILGSGKCCVLWFWSLCAVAVPLVVNNSHRAAVSYLVHPAVVCRPSPGLHSF